ncbi:MAG: methyltransferase [Deltaproteobacteria bacterium]|nr:methyltransferase [Deltaproteobacteria bacterium]
METNWNTGIRKPRSDEHLLWDILMGIRNAQAVFVAHDLKLFAFLAEKPATLEEVSRSLQIAERPAEAILTTCVSFGLLQIEEDRYLLTPFAEDYLLENSPTYFGPYLDYSIINQELMTFDSLKKAVISNASQVYGGTELYLSHKEEVSRARGFTAMMHSHSIGPASAWPERIDLSGSRIFLDIGGGSGAHSFGAVQRWPGLRGIVFDLPLVSEVTKEYIECYGFQDRIMAQGGDMWTDSFPPADVHFYADIFHDFSPRKCLFLSRKSYEGLDPGGRIIIHEMLLNDAKDGPPAVAGYSISMLLWTEGRQFSGSELAEMLAEAGFVDIQVIPTFGYWGLVTGLKPRR